MPFYLRVLIGVALGTALGMAAQAGNYKIAWLSDLGMLVITLLKTLATPLILFAVLDAFLRTRIPARKGAKLVGIGLLNAIVAIAIGLTLATLLHAGESWQGRMDQIQRSVGVQAAGRKEVDEDQERVEDVIAALVKKGVLTKKEAQPRPASLDPLRNFVRYVPKNLPDPFRRNNVITVVLLAVLGGAALRTLQDHGGPDTTRGMEALEGVIRVGFQASAQMLEWIVWLIPFAVFGIVANVVSHTGPGVFTILGTFLWAMALGLFLHAFVYYSLLLRVVGRVSPLWFFRQAAEPIITSLSVGSSLATLPVTLRALNDRLRVSTDSARLAACVGTNLNHDGIILYEAAAAIFIAQAFGYHLSVAQMAAVALASAMAGVGIAGVPEAGLITLPLVLSAAGLPAEIVATVIPLILPVDWILGRCRACVNVISDMTVATLLDRTEPNPALAVTPSPTPPESRPPGLAGRVER
jgi:DAACS family dicarboxylate/amino acid:cation (Na+ or H+) symporter